MTASGGHSQDTEPRGSGTDRFDPSPWSVRITAVLLAVVAVLLVISMIE